MAGSENLYTSLLEAGPARRRPACPLWEEKRREIFVQMAGSENLYTSLLEAGPARRRPACPLWEEKRRLNLYTSLLEAGPARRRPACPLWEEKRRLPVKIGPGKRLCRAVKAGIQRGCVSGGQPRGSFFFCCRAMMGISTGMGTHFWAVHNSCTPADGTLISRPWRIPRRASATQCPAEMPETCIPVCSRQALPGGGPPVLYGKKNAVCL